MIWGINVAPFNLQRLMESLISIVKAKTNTSVNTYVYLDDVLMTSEKDKYDDLTFFYKELRTFLARAGVVVNEIKSSSEP